MRRGHESLTLPERASCRYSDSLRTAEPDGTSLEATQVRRRHCTCPVCPCLRRVQSKTRPHEPAPRRCRSYPHTSSPRFCDPALMQRPCVRGRRRGLPVYDGRRVRQAARLHRLDLRRHLPQLQRARGLPLHDGFLPWPGQVPRRVRRRGHVHRVPAGRRLQAGAYLRAREPVLAVR